jgi:hypothetical protein
MLESFVPQFDWDIHRRDMTLENPVNANLIKGESTNATAGRGKRAAIILLDEFPFMQGFAGIWTATRAASYHRIAVGSVSTSKGMDAYNLYKSGNPAIIEMDSRFGMHPRQDSQWHEHERRRDPAGYDQEVGLNWFADATDFVYPESQKIEPGDYPYLPFAGPAFIAIDDGNHWAMWWLQYIRSTGRIRILDGYQGHGKTTSFYGAMMNGIAVAGFTYGENEHAILKLARETPITAVMGDTHGRHVEQIAGMSVIEDLATQWGITVNVDYERRDHVDRKSDLSDLMPSIDVNKTPRTTHMWECVRRYKYKSTPVGKETAREVREPQHNDDSHAPTALEFWATQFTIFRYAYAGLEPIYVGEHNR